MYIMCDYSKYNDIGVMLKQLNIKCPTLDRIMV